MDFQRLILFGALGMVLLLLWQAWLEHDSSKNNANFNSNTSMSAASGTAQNGAYGTKVEADDVPQAPTASAAPESADTPSAIPVNQSLPGDAGSRWKRIWSVWRSILKAVISGVWVYLPTLFLWINRIHPLCC